MVSQPDGRSPLWTDSDREQEEIFRALLPPIEFVKARRSVLLSRALEMFAAEGGTCAFCGAQNLDVHEGVLYCKTCNKVT